ncbi:leucine zipper transcription factor-like protein 1 [Cricetulus griseus]|uniref:Leucine zipper transcription factor-like protein 1 n=1 Tax=Cricetulus griseus TaxID=10029 RepID=A0A061I437_CRIGR|nr:leucine zipper transcription factor-like protein 1 [Cricetulus griseus]
MLAIGVILFSEDRRVVPKQVYSQHIYCGNSEYYAIKKSCCTSEIQRIQLSFIELLEQIAEFEKAEFTSSSKKPIIDITKPKLVPINEGGTTELLNKEILRLQQENEKLKSRLKTIEIQTTNALDEKSKLERTLQDLQIDQENQQDFIKAHDLDDLENTVAALRDEFQKTLNDQTENQKSLEQNLAAAKHDLLRVQEQLSLAEKELEKKFQQTAAYRNMKEILTKKNDQIKDLRKRLAKYESED